MEQYKEGTVFELDENSGREYIILKNIIYNEEFYLIVSPVIGDKDNLKMEASGMFVLKVDSNTNNIEFIKDDETIKIIVDKMFE